MGTGVLLTVSPRPTRGMLRALCCPGLVLAGVRGGLLRHGKDGHAPIDPRPASSGAWAGPWWTRRDSPCRRGRRTLQADREGGRGRLLALTPDGLDSTPLLSCWLGATGLGPP